MPYIKYDARTPQSEPYIEWYIFRDAGTGDDDDDECVMELYGRYMSAELVQGIVDYLNKAEEQDGSLGVSLIPDEEEWIRNHSKGRN